MKHLLSLLFGLCSLSAFSQWEEQDVPLSTRYDDIFFIDKDLGWAAGGNNMRIYKTTDGGRTWTEKFTAASYLRSIEFASSTLGFVGTLNGELYTSQDAGETWNEITQLLPQSVPGICGLAAPSASVIYGCGKWTGDIPAFIIKSTDGGASWMYKDMSQWATQLIDLFFINENEGYATGMANPRTDGGIILHTTDGGANWEVVYKTMVERDYIWKIQTPDSLNYFGSIQSLPSTENVRIAKSTDGANTWNTLMVQENKWNYMQMVGFRDAMNGWTGGTANPGEGGETALFETTDGGLTWNLNENTTNSFKTFNRFFMVDKDNIFMTGRKIYKYAPGGIIDPDPLSTQSPAEHVLSVSPNPVQNLLKIEINLTNRTSCWLDIIDASGRLIKEVYKGDLNAGLVSYEIDTHYFSKGLYFVCLHTNENMFYRKIRKD